MLYDLPANISKTQLPQWPVGTGSIPAEFSDRIEIGVPIYKGVNYLSLGVVGTGKTTSFIVPAAKGLLNSDPAMRGVFFEIKRTFIDFFMEPEDKVITHDPNAVPSNNLFVPNIIKEIRQSADREAEMRDITEFLFDELLKNANQNRAWVEAARNSFIGVLRTIIDCYPDANTSNWTLVNALRRMSTHELLSYLARHPRNHSMLRKDWGFDPKHPEQYTLTRRSADISFFLNQALERFSGSFEMKSEHANTIHDWLNGHYGRNLFFLYDLTSSQVSRPFFLYYMKKIKDYKLSNFANNTPPILMVLDELDKMADRGCTADWGLFQAANLGREYNLQILFASQSLENLYGLSPDFNEHIVMGGIAGFPVTVAFRQADPVSTQRLQTLFGSEYKEHIVMPASRYAAPVVQNDIQPIVTDTEFASLKTGEAFIKIMDDYPWKVRFIRK